MRIRLKCMKKLCDVLTFLTFRRRLLFWIAGLAETFPSFSVSGPFLLDVPGFQVPSDSIVPLQFGLPLGRFHSIFISATARMFSVSPLLLTCPNHSSLLRLITVAIASTFASSSFLRCSNRLTPIAHRTILIYVVAIRFSSLTDIGHVSHP